MKVTMLSGGWFTGPVGIWRRGEDLERRVRFPVPAYLIETETERILVDTGLHPDAVADPAGRYGDDPALAAFTSELERPVAEQLDLDTLTRVVLTHLHVDHVGGLELIPASVPLVIQRREWEAGHDRAATERNFFLPVDYAGQDRPVELLDGDHDLLGDGSVVLLLTPGHTPGHQSVRVGERLVIGGDVTMFASGLDDHRFPVFGEDFTAQAASAERLRFLRDSGARVLPGHDPELIVAGPVEI